MTMFFALVNFNISFLTYFNLLQLTLIHFNPFQHTTTYINPLLLFKPNLNYYIKKFQSISTYYNSLQPISTFYPTQFTFEKDRPYIIALASAQNDEKELSPKYTNRNFHSHKPRFLPCALFLNQ